MKPLFDISTLDSFKGTKTLLPLECEQCGNTFELLAKDIRRTVKGGKSNKIWAKYCSINCSGLALRRRVGVNCKNCNVNFKKVYSEFIRIPNHFCSRSCSATFNNKNKTHGTRRSKLEVYIENKLKNEYSHIQFLSNDKTTISSELDFYFPDIKIAIELSGIVHYQPIYGQHKFDMIVNNDKEKQNLCIQNGITLYVVNTSTLKYNCERNYIPYYEIVKDILNKNAPSN